jgi:predicted DNA-binding protein (UPF0251 family)
MLGGGLMLVGCEGCETYETCEKVCAEIEALIPAPEEGSRRDIEIHLDPRLYVTKFHGSLKTRSFPPSVPVHIEFNGLSKQEEITMESLKDGETFQSIADRLGVSKSTVQSYYNRAKKKAYIVRNELSEITPEIRDLWRQERVNYVYGYWKAMGQLDPPDYFLAVV